MTAEQKFLAACPNAHHVVEPGTVHYAHQCVNFAKLKAPAALSALRGLSCVY